MLKSHLRHIKKFLFLGLRQLLLSRKETDALLAKQSHPYAIAALNRQIRRRASLLLLIGILSFLLGIGYGLIQRYSKGLAYSEIEDTEVSSTTQPTPKTPVQKPPKVPPKTNIRIKAVGDIVPGTNYPANRLHPQRKLLFSAVKPLLKGADFLFGNFESTLTNYPHSPKGFGGGMIIPFRTPPSYNQLLKDAGFDIMSVANNHSFDFALPGFKDTIHNLENAGIKALGKKGQILIANYKGLSIAWIGFSYFDYHNSVNNMTAAKSLVQKARENADIVVVSFHAGAEGTSAMRVKNQTEFFAGENRGNLVNFSHTMIDNGADLILGHSPHVPRALELYKGKLIAYSLGNFLGYRTLSTAAQLAYSLVLEVELDNQGNLISGKIIPVILNDQGIPYPDRQGRSIRLIHQLTQSDFPNTPLIIKPDGKIFPRKQS